MNRKIIFFDADGTIQDAAGVSELTKIAFRKLREKGHILVLSTGRALPAIDGDLAELGFENIICSGGNCVVIDNNIVYNNSLSQGKKEILTAYLDKNNIIYNMESNDHIWIKKGLKDKYLRLFNNSIEEKRYAGEEQYNKAIQRVERISNRTWEVEDVMEIEVNKIHYYNPPIAQEKIINDLSKDFDIVPLSVSKDFSGGEISDKGITKKTGMDIILDHFDIESENIYAIGDDYNDIEMFKNSNISIAMGHAPNLVKEHADFITGTLKEDGFYYAMKHFDLI